MSRQPPTVTSASTSSAALWAFTQVHGPLDGTLLLEMEPFALRTEPTRQTDARPALAYEAACRALVTASGGTDF